ncbi:MAG: prealbumin-like fold domain-containing protein [Clostridiales bacterium]|jgi:hypothetical protein|nr:prealbumin-like fold domain-containing protein [Clostridiales bacterium]
MNYIYNDNKNMRVCCQDDFRAKPRGCGQPAETPACGRDCGCYRDCDCNCEKPAPGKCPEAVLKTKRLEGVKFDLIEETGGCVIACGRTDCHGELEFSGIPFGSYSLRETEPKDGYDFDGRPIHIDLSCAHPRKCVEVRNRMRQGAIKIVKFGEEEKFAMPDGCGDCGRGCGRSE